MIIAVYVIGSAVAFIMLNARLRDAQEELTRTQEEYGAYVQAVRMSLAFLLAGLAAMHWSAASGSAGQTHASSRADAPDRRPE
jgi:hypothetical protein